MSCPVRFGFRAALAILLFLAGCASTHPVRTIVINAPVTIHIADMDTVRAMGLREGIDPSHKFAGFCTASREIWCIDDPEILLHELRHLPEWDGLFHVEGFSGRQIEAPVSEVALDDR